MLTIQVESSTSDGHKTQSSYRFLGCFITVDVSKYEL